MDRGSRIGHGMSPCPHGREGLGCLTCIVDATSEYSGMRSEAYKRFTIVMSGDGFISEEQIARLAEEVAKRPLTLSLGEFARLETSAREWADLIDGPRPRPRLWARIWTWLRGFLS